MNLTGHIPISQTLIGREPVKEFFDRGALRGTETAIEFPAAIELLKHP